jgi:hypothetical protein
LKQRVEERRKKLYLDEVKDLRRARVGLPRYSSASRQNNSCRPLSSKQRRLRSRAYYDRNPISVAQSDVAASIAQLKSFQNDVPENLGMASRLAAEVSLLRRAQHNKLQLVRSAAHFKLPRWFRDAVGVPDTSPCCQTIILRRNNQGSKVLSAFSVRTCHSRIRNM